MKNQALVTALFGILLAGCSLRGHPAKSAAVPAAPKPVVNPAPPPPPPVLSTPQTRVQLPKPQPLDPAAFATETTTPEPEPEPEPAAVPPARSRRTLPAPVQPATPPAATPAEPRETVQEIVAESESKRLREQAQSRRREANQILEQLGKHLTSAQQNVATTIRSFVALSEEAEKHDDPRQADALAERAQILAKELQGGK